MGGSHLRLFVLYLICVYSFYWSFLTTSLVLYSNETAMSHQDWDTVTFSKAKLTGSKATDQKVVNQARRTGDQVETSTKFMGGQNRAGGHNPCPNAAKLEQETENFRHDHVSHEFKLALQQARMAKKMTQAQL